jgi:uncharacterized FlaG/YvyC family protein
MQPVGPPPPPSPGATRKGASFPEPTLLEVADALRRIAAEAGRPISIRVDATGALPVVIVSDFHSGQVIRRIPPLEARRLVTLAAEGGAVFLDQER